MPDVVAKAMAVVTGFLLVGTIAILVLTSRPPAGTREVVAEFRDAFPVLEGMQVRTDGAISGTIGTIGVDKRGLAEVTLLVDRAIPAPRADATATIRQADSTGDSYVAYDPGSESAPLRKEGDTPTIACDAPSPVAPCTNTLAAPRLDDLINAFGPSEQAGVKLIVQSLADAVDQRGTDINRAALDLLPALDAANRALDEVNGQNTALKRLIGNMEDVAGQAAGRREELGDLIASLDQTLDTTAANTAPLGAGIEKLATTQRRARTTLRRLTATADATRPLATELAGAAPGLSTLLTRAPSFLGDVRAAITQGRPTLDLTTKLLRAGAPTIAADPQRVVTGAFDLAPALSNLLKGVLGGDETIKAFFGDDNNGKPENREGFGFGFGAIASEPGNQPGYPASYKDRTFVRYYAMLTCQSFGVAVKPGCLADLLAAQRGARGDGGSDPDREPAAKPTTPKPAVEAPIKVVQDQVKPVTGKVRAPVGTELDTDSVDDLLHFLLG